MITEDHFLVQQLDEDLVQVRIKEQDYVLDYSATMDFLMQLAVVAGKMESSQYESKTQNEISYKQH